MTPSKMKVRQEGSGTYSRAKSKNRTPQIPLGSLPFTAFDPGSLKGGRVKAAEGCYQDGWGNKARIQAGGGPKASNTPSRLPDSMVTDGEGGPPPQMEGSQHREEASRQQRELGKEEEGLQAERRPASLLQTVFQLRQAIGALQIEDHKI